MVSTRPGADYVAPGKNSSVSHKANKTRVLLHTYFAAHRTCMSLQQRVCFTSKLHNQNTSVIHPFQKLFVTTNVSPSRLINLIVIQTCSSFQEEVSGVDPTVFRRYIHNEEVEEFEDEVGEEQFSDKRSEVSHFDPFLLDQQDI
jgi:hypothetical protein